MISYREYVVEIIDRFYSTSKNLKTLQINLFNKYKIPPSDRNRIIVLSRELLRYKGRIDWYIKNHINSPFNRLQNKLLVILELGTYELMFDNKVPNYAAINSAVELAKSKLNRKASGLVNAVLRKISKEMVFEKPKGIEDHNYYSYPKWIFNKWIDQFGSDKTKKLCEYFNEPHSLVIRRNSNKIENDEFVKNMPQDVSIELISDSDKFYKVKSGGAFLKNSDSFKNGEFSFQDRAAGMIVEVLDPQPHETILDVCCAPGTKTNYIAELIGNTGNVYACDIDNNRLKTTEEDSKRLRNSNISFNVKDAAKDIFPMADKILIDAPCTGTGTIGRRPDIKWRRKPVHLDRVIKLQKSILKNVSQYVKPGRTLVYATCSLENEENWQVVEAFLKLHDDFKVESIQNQQLTKYIDKKSALSTFPPKAKMDGMFAVKMVKNEK